MSKAILPDRSEQRSLAAWRWCFLRAPDGPADIRVVESEDRVVGSIVHVPVAVWIEGRKRRLAIGCDLMIDPEFRGKVCRGSS